MRKNALFSILSILFFCNITSAESFNQTSFQVAELKDAKRSIAFLDTISQQIKEHINGWELTHFGMSIKLELSKDNRIYLYPKESGISLEQYCSKLLKYCELTKYRTFPLFVEYDNISQKRVEEAFKNTKITDYIYHQAEGQLWPDDISKIEVQKKNIVIFSFNKLPHHSNILTSVSNNIAEMPFTSFSNPRFEGNYITGSIDNELLMLKHFTDRNVNTKSLKDKWQDFNFDPFYPNYVKKCWNLTGKKPNFIFFEDEKLVRKFMWIELILKRTPSIYGTITYEGKVLNNIHWQHSTNTITSRMFSFPRIEDETVYTPICLGSYFTPASIPTSVYDEHSNKVSFKAKSYDLEEGLTGFYPFDEDLKNLAQPKMKTQNNGCELITDISKGNILKLNPHSHIALAPTTEFGIVNNSMTIAFDCKAIEVMGRDAVWVASSERFPRKGLSIFFRFHKPYAGFFNDDIIAPLEINKNEWYHYVFRYEILSGELSIFINGEKQCSTNNHPSMIGTSILVAGSGEAFKKEFEGAMDNLAIWDRAISDAEIKMLYARGIDKSKIKTRKLNKDQNNQPVLLYIVGFVVLLIILLSIAWQIRKKKKAIASSENLPTESSSNLANIVPEPNENALFLFGNFTAYDKDGIDISKSFSPKIKELLLLIFFHTQKTNSGISSLELTDIIWHGLPSKKATNNRGVAFNKLRHCLENLDSVIIKFENEHWNISISDKVYCDFVELNNIIKKEGRVSTEELHRVYTITQRGKLLQRLSWPWLEEFKIKVMYDIAEVLLEYCNRLKETKNTKLLCTVSAHVLEIDDLNEQALYYQLYALEKNGNISKARFMLEKFSNDFKKNYGEDFKKTLDDILSKVD